MRTTLLAFAIIISGMSVNLDAAPIKHHGSVHKVHKSNKSKKRRPVSRASSSSLRTIPPGGMRAALGGGKARPAEPVAPLPGTPAIGPASLVHLERILPSDVVTTPPADTPNPAGAAFSSHAASSTPSLAGMRPVLPEEGDEPDDLVSIPSSGPASTEFQAADRSNLDLLWPVETRTISSAWGPRIRTRVVRVRVNRRNKRVLRRFMGTHKGVDLSAPMGADIYAAMDGQVVLSARQKDYGNLVAIDHGNGVVTLYAHCSRNFVTEGEIVHRGQKIAEVGRTGNATGPHVHFELRLDGLLPVNPLPYMNDMEEIPADTMALNRAAVPPPAIR